MLMLPLDVATYRLRRSAKRLVGHGRIPPHHLLRFPTPERHYDRRGETSIEGSGRPMVAKVVEASRDHSGPRHKRPVTDKRPSRSLWKGFWAIGSRSRSPETIGL